jgi:hypothetical protein
MEPVTLWHRLYFAAVGLLALWVGAWGYFRPAQVDTAIPWLVPPLHARFLGAMYLSGATFMLGCILARRWNEVQVVVVGIAIWTGMLLVVSLFYLDQFDYTRTQVWIWFAAYLIYPLIASWLAWRHRGTANDASMQSTPDPGLPRWIRYYLLAQGFAASTLALALLLAPRLMASAWPWAITPLLAQIYSAPFLSYGIMSLLLAYRRTWPEIRVAVAAILVFSAGVLIASLMHRGLFSAANPAAWLWFGSFAAATMMLAVLTVRALTAYAKRIGAR